MKKSTIEKIISPTRLPINDDTVANWSALLSNKFQAQLLLYNAVRTEAAEGEATNTAQNNKINEMLKSALDRLRDLGANLEKAHKVNYVVEVSNHWRNLVRQIQDESADLLVTKMPDQGDTTPGKLTALMYNCPCPIFFAREGMVPTTPKRILLPLKKKDGLEQLLPVVVEFAKQFGATICLSTFDQDGNTGKEKLRLMQRAERMAKAIRKEGVNLETEAAHGFHFGTTVIQRAHQNNADMIAITVQPSNYFTRLFTKMVGPFFLENSHVPVLVLPLPNTVRETLDLPVSEDATAIKTDEMSTLTNS